MENFQWKYKNLIFLAISIFIAIYLVANPTANKLFESIGELGYIGGFIVGFLFTYGITTPLATATIFLLGGSVNPFLLAVFGATGALISDFLIFKFIRDRLLSEIGLAAEELQIPTGFFYKLLHNKMFLKIAPVIAGFILASPLPDELAVALFAATRYNPKHFAIFSYGSNFIGILLISLAGQAF